ncbi:MAG TPA: hypothetical protein VFX25_19125 [Streptosporangiaceae bacterium]|nr:hypothetical protein [Streptosporangiaceae bacterium]
MTALLAVAAVALVLSATRVRLALSWRHGAALAAVLAAVAAPGAGPGIVPLAAAAVVVAVLAAAGSLALVLVLARRTVPACLRGAS